MGLPRVERPVAPPARTAEAAQRRRWYRRIPLACWACMAVAALNALVWNVITPAFQVPDEPVQVGYAQYLAETGKLPRPLSPYFDGSPEENDVMAGTGFSTLAKAEFSPLRGESLV